VTVQTARLILLVALLNVLDVLLTAHVLGAGGVEAIPLSRWLIDKYGYVYLGWVKVSASVVLVWALCEREWRWFSGKNVANGIAVALSLVCAWNLFGVVAS
jgi:hypothetical protein